MKTAPKFVLREMLSQERFFYNFADAAALGGEKPAKILAEFSFKEFSKLVEKIKEQSFPGK